MVRGNPFLQSEDLVVRAMATLTAVVCQHSSRFRLRLTSWGIRDSRGTYRYTSIY